MNLLKIKNWKKFWEVLIELMPGVNNLTKKINKTEKNPKSVNFIEDLEQKWQHKTINTKYKNAYENDNSNENSKDSLNDPSKNTINDTEINSNYDLLTRLKKQCNFPMKRYRK